MPDAVAIAANPEALAVSYTSPPFSIVTVIGRHVADVRNLLLKHGMPAATHVFYTPRGVRALPDSERPLWDRALTRSS
jgi:hypothetical protein